MNAFGKEYLMNACCADSASQCFIKFQMHSVML